MLTLYRYTSEGEGIFTIGKRDLPDFLVDEAYENRKWLPKPNLPEGEYRFYLTLKGKQKYEETLLNVHKKYLKDIKLEEYNLNNEKIVYEDEYQVVISI